MKLFWMLGCFWTAGHFVGTALGGRPEYGGLAWLGVTLDWTTVAYFVGAGVAAIRADARWLFPSRPIPMNQPPNKGE